MPLLRRIVGQNISIVLHVAAEPAVVLIDPGQLDRVLLNLAIHARDAMPSGGTLTIGAGQATFEERFVNDQWPSMPGTFAVLAVTDSGGGMNEAPGLSTLFAFVKQHGGFVWVYSTPAQGTSFKVYLPVQRAVATVECRG